MPVSDRPIAGVLAALAAAMFVVAFSAAAVTRPDSAGEPEAAAARTAPATAQENSRAATIAAPSLSRVAALPALHLPTARKPKRSADPKPTPRPATAAPTAAPPAATAAPPVQRTAPPQPPRRRSNVGETFDTSG
jgi:hypothetical protein